MRDLHFDGDFLRDFNAASEKWAWATWRHNHVSEDATARRLLAQVFGAQESADDAGDESGLAGDAEV